MTGRDETSFVNSLVRDLEPVHPLARPGIRAVMPALIALACGALFILIAGFRSDLSTGNASAISALAMFRLLVGALLIYLAMKEAVPSEGWSGRNRMVVLLASVAAVALLPMFLLLVTKADGGSRLEPLTCFPLVAIVAFPTFALTLVLLARAYALRPVLTGLIAGLGTGFLAEAAIFLECDNAGIAHGIAIHGGAVLTLALAGALAGWVIGRSHRTNTYQMM